MKRSKKLLFIIVPSLVVFFALSFLLTSTRQEELNTENLSTDTIITKKSIFGDMEDEMESFEEKLKKEINEYGNDDTSRDQERDICNVKIQLQGTHSAPGSAWLNKCLKYTPWKCGADVEGPYDDFTTCEKNVERAAYVTTEGIKSVGIALVKWECPVVEGVYCAKNVHKYNQAQESTDCESRTETTTDIKTGKEKTVKICVTTTPIMVCGGEPEQVNWSSSQCFTDKTKEGSTGFENAVKETINPKNNITEVNYTDCTDFLGNYICDSVNRGCCGYAPAMSAELIRNKGDLKNCCGNVCQGCNRTCYTSGPSLEGIDGEQFTATYEGTTFPAYCVNQHLLMPQGSLAWDSTFNVTACENSLSSKDCGYGYILLKAEVERKKDVKVEYSYGVINVALRLWAASETLGRAAGYVGTPGVPLSMSRGFVPKHWNVYIQTGKKENLRRYINSTNSKGVSLNGSYKNVTELEDLHEIKCSEMEPDPKTGKDMGILCTSTNGNTGTLGEDVENLIPNGEERSDGERNVNNSTEYLKSLYLYMLALQGNKMPTSELFEEEDIRRPYIPSDASVDYVSIDENNFYTIIKFKMSRKVEQECESGDTECNTNIFISTKPFDKNVTKEELEKNPEKYGVISNITSYDECKKNICYARITNTKVCTETEEGNSKQLYYRVVTPKNKADMSVKKLVACNAPGENQIFFAFDENGVNVNKVSYSSEDYTDSSIKVTCPCNPKNKCMNNDIVDRRKDVCQTKTNKDGSVNKEEDNKNYDTYENYSIEDPSMNCIINMCYEGQQNQYDYSDKYGVNKKYCTLYCRDEVRFYLANKTKVYTGMQFRYDVGTKLKKNGVIKEQVDTNDFKYLTSVVREERHCTSVIKYNTWREDFEKATNDDDREQLIYDLENCNLYDIPSNKDGECNYNEVDKINVCKYYEDAKLIVNADGTKSKYTTVGYIKATLKCEGNGNDDSCASMELEYDSKYSYGVNEYAKDEGQVVSEVKYCSGPDCYKFECDYATEAGSYEDRVKKCNEWSKTEGAEFDPVGENQTITEKSYNDIKIPINDYAAIIISDEVDFSNPIKYQTRAYTGDIKKVENDEVEDMYTPVGKNSFPVELNQRTFINDPLDKSKWKFVNHKYTFRLLVDRPNKLMHKYLGNVAGYQYDYDYTCYFDVYNKSTDYSCDPEANYNKCYEISADGVVTFHDSFKDENGNEVACSKECVQSGGYGFIFRNVQLDNMFPSEAVRDTGNNWTTDKAKEAIKEIEASADKMYTTDDYLEYSYTITPEAIKSIKDYNKQEESSGGYQNSTLYGCESSKTNVSAFENCKSKFLEEIGKDETVLGMNITAHKSDGISKYTQNKNKTTISAGE